MKREGFWQRLRGTLGKRVKDEKKAERAALKKEKKEREMGGGQE
jgi:hypothetical protein